MTRPTRMVIVLGLFGIVAVAALAMMAQRYSKLLQRVEPGRPAATAPAASDSRPPAAPGGAGSIEAQARALRYVDAFIEIRKALAAAPPSTDPAEGPGEESDGPVLDRALADAGLDRAAYEGVLQLYTAWKAGREELPGPLPAAFEQRREELQALE